MHIYFIYIYIYVLKKCTMRALILCLVEVRRQLGVIPDSSPTVIYKKNCLYIYSVQKMILKFDLKLLWWT